MFPRYNPAVPLAHQAYYPKIENTPTLAHLVGVGEGSSQHHPTLSTHQEPPKNAENGTESNAPKASLENVLDISMASSQNSVRPVNISTPEELIELWSIANGQTPREASASYTLELSWFVDKFSCY